MTREVVADILRYLSLQPVSYATILELDRKVNELEAEIPSLYNYQTVIGGDPSMDPIRCLRTFMIQLVICQERLRLHRPYQTRANVDGSFLYSRTVCLATASQILDRKSVV